VPTAISVVFFQTNKKTTRNTCNVILNVSFVCHQFDYAFLQGMPLHFGSQSLSPVQDGSDVLQFQRFRVFHPLPKQAHHGILKTLWDKRVQWNQGLNARRTKQLLQAFLDQDVRLGIPSQALPLPATAPRPAVTAAPAAVAAAATLPVLPAASSAAAAPTTATATPATAAAAKPSLAAAPASPARTPTTAADTATTAEAGAQPQAKAGGVSPAVSGAVVAGRATASAQSPHASPARPGTLDSSNTVHLPSPATTPVNKPMHQRKGQRAAANRKLALSSSPGHAETAPPAVTPRPDFTPLTPTSTQDQSEALHGFDDVPLEAFQLQSGELDHMPGDDLSDLPDLPPLHLSKAQHRSVRTDDGEEVHVLVSPVRSQGGDDSPSSPSRLPDSVLKAMCNMGKAFLSRYSISLLLNM